MTRIVLSTEINASIDRCFDLARSVEVHIQSTRKTNEIVVKGRFSGLCEEGDVITWEATHFWIRQRLTVEITKMERPFAFEDKMLEGAFKSMHHVHQFKRMENKTIMSDVFEYEVPFGVVGRVFDKLVLKRYMTSFLRIRNCLIKSLAETNDK